MRCDDDRPHEAPPRASPFHRLGEPEDPDLIETSIASNNSRRRLV